MGEVTRAAEVPAVRWEGERREVLISTSGRCEVLIRKLRARGAKRRGAENEKGRNREKGRETETTYRHE